jgi:hypothetical protein
MTNCCGIQLADRNLEVRLLSFLLRCDHADQRPDAANGSNYRAAHRLGMLPSLHCIDCVFIGVSGFAERHTRR